MRLHGQLGSYASYDASSKLKVELAFLTVLLMCVPNLRSSDMVIPRYGFDETCCSIVLSKL